MCMFCIGLDTLLKVDCSKLSLRFLLFFKQKVAENFNYLHLLLLLVNLLSDCWLEMIANWVERLIVRIITIL